MNLNLGPSARSLIYLNAQLNNKVLYEKLVEDFMNAIRDSLGTPVMFILIYCTNNITLMNERVVDDDTLDEYEEELDNNEDYCEDIITEYSFFTFSLCFTSLA